MAMSFFPRHGATRIHTFGFHHQSNLKKSIRPSSLYLRLQNWVTNPEGSKREKLVWIREE